MHELIGQLIGNLISHLEALSSSAIGCVNLPLISSRSKKIKNKAHIISTIFFFPLNKNQPVEISSFSINELLKRSRTSTTVHAVLIESSRRLNFIAQNHVILIKTTFSNITCTLLFSATDTSFVHRSLTEMSFCQSSSSDAVLHSHY